MVSPQPGVLVLEGSKGIDKVYMLARPLVFQDRTVPLTVWFWLDTTFSYLEEDLACEWVQRAYLCPLHITSL